MPVIPFITDTPIQMEQSIQQAKNVGVDFIIFSGMTLKDGRQKEYFYRVIEKYQPELLPAYLQIYQESQWGNATHEYYQSIHQTFFNLIKKHKILPRIPLELFQNILEENDLVVVILEHIDYLLKLMNRTSPFGFAAYSISQLKEPLSSIFSS